MWTLAKTQRVVTVEKFLIMEEKMSEPENTPVIETDNIAPESAGGHEQHVGPGKAELRLQRMNSFKPRHLLSRIVWRPT